MALFTSADPVFASYVNLPTVSSGLLNNLVIIVLGAAATLGLTRLAKTRTDDPAFNRSQKAASEATTKLCAGVPLPTYSEVLPSGRNRGPVEAS